MKVEIDLHGKQCFIVAPARYEGESCPELEWDNEEVYYCKVFGKRIRNMQRCEECLKSEEQQ